MAAHFKEVFNFPVPSYRSLCTSVKYGFYIFDFFYPESDLYSKGKTNAFQVNTISYRFGWQVHMTVIVRDSQGHPAVPTMSFRHDRNPRETRVSSKTTRVLTACCCRCFSLLPQINFEQLEKSIIRNNSLSTATTSELFPKALWAHQRYANVPVNSLSA